MCIRRLSFCREGKSEKKLILSLWKQDLEKWSIKKICYDNTSKRTGQTRLCDILIKSENEWWERTKKQNSKRIRNGHNDAIGQVLQPWAKMVLTHWFDVNLSGQIYWNNSKMSIVLFNSFLSSDWTVQLKHSFKKSELKN